MNTDNTTRAGHSGGCRRGYLVNTAGGLVMGVMVQETGDPIHRLGTKRLLDTDRAVRIHEDLWRSAMMMRMMVVMRKGCGDQVTLDGHVTLPGESGFPIDLAVDIQG